MSHPKNISRNVHVLVNPNAGRHLPVLPTIQKFLTSNHLDWEVRTSNTKEELASLIKNAKQSCADVVAIYGGDGTIQAAAKSLLTYAMTLSILPGGSGNVLSKSLHIPQNLKQNLEILRSGKYTTRFVDVGQMDGDYFIIRVSLGVEAKLVEKTKRNLKKQLGIMAYATSGLNALLQARASRYELTLDQHRVDIEGVSCTIANSGNLGIPGISVSSNIKLDDGLFDVLVIPKVKLGTLTQALLKITSKGGRDEIFKHWQAKAIEVRMHPPQMIHCDGEMVDKSMIKIKMIPKALKILVPETKV